MPTSMMSTKSRARARRVILRVGTLASHAERFSGGLGLPLEHGSVSNPTQ